MTFLCKQNSHTQENIIQSQPTLRTRLNKKFPFQHVDDNDVSDTISIKQLIVCSILLEYGFLVLGE